MYWLTAGTEAIVSSIISAISYSLVLALTEIVISVSRSDSVSVGLKAYYKLLELIASVTRMTDALIIVNEPK